MSIEIKNLRRNTFSEPYDVKVDRSSVLGNPFYMSKSVGLNRDDVCDKYERWFKKQFGEFGEDGNKPFNIEIGRLERLYELHGKLRLFCWCAPRRCHAETIKKYLESILGII